MNVLSNVNVLNWAQDASPGERVVYARRMVQDVEYGTGRKGLGPAKTAHEKGLVFLAQRRCPGGFLYEATRISSRTARLLGLDGRLEVSTMGRGKVR